MSYRRSPTLLATTLPHQPPNMTPHPRANDNVYLKSLSLPPLVVGADAWGRPDKPQPVLVSIKWYNPLPATDSLAGTLNYSTIAKDITSALEARRGGFSSAQSLIEFILYVAVEKGWKGVALGIEVDLPKAILEAGEGLKVGRGYDLQGHGGMDVEMEGGLQAPFGKEELYPRARIGDVRVLCVIGINPHERLAKQTVRVDLEVEEDLAIGSRDGIASHWRGLVKHAVEVS